MDEGGVKKAKFSTFKKIKNKEQLVEEVKKQEEDAAFLDEMFQDNLSDDTEHQDDVRVALRWLAEADQVDADRLGVVAISLGIAMACGALAHLEGSVRVQWLLDWEGPCDREIICAGGRIMAPALGHSLEDEVYWRPREAVRWVGELPCGYQRVQSVRDHAQPGEVRHAARMIQAAAGGRLPWFRLNDHEPGLVPRTPELYPPGRLQANRVLLRWIRRLSD